VGTNRTDSQVKFCLYCTKDFGDGSREHFVPQALGVSVPTNPFLITNVCDRCNKLLGKFVDGPFSRNFLIQNHRANLSRRFVNLSVGEAMPLSYMGNINKSIEYVGHDCDFYIGPTGDAVYHFHLPYPELHFGGGPESVPFTFPSNTFDPGFVMLVVRATNPIWNKTIKNSVKNQFIQETKIYVVNRIVTPESKLLAMPVELEDLKNKIVNLGGKHEVQTTVNLDFDAREIAKMALGFGYLVMGDAFARSKDAQTIRDLLWAKSPEEKTKTIVRGAGVFSNQDASKDPVGWDSGHVFLLKDVGEALALHVNLFGQISATIQISSDQSLWMGKILSEGTIYILAPGLRKSVGPISVGDYLVVKGGHARSSEAFACLLDEANASPIQPPFDLPNEIS